MKTHPESVINLEKIGISYSDALALRRVAMIFHNWHERECGLFNGAIERDEKTDKPYWVNAMTGRRFAIPDMEKGAIKRLITIMANYPTLDSYIQTDPRGASLYILRAGDVPAGENVESYYSRGIAVYK